jgi:hypothetical protein
VVSIGVALPSRSRFWILVDAIVVISGQMKDSEGKLIKKWQIG